MGGFELRGPKFKIVSTDVQFCHCTKFYCDIDEEIEAVFVDNNGQISRRQFNLLTKTTKRYCLSYDSDILKYDVVPSE